jgi:DNA-binding response OmpR family regulator
MRVLVVEDQMIIALEIAGMLVDLGCQVVGPVGDIRSALEMVHDEPLDAAILDVSLDGEMVFPVALELRARDVSFVFATGYGAGSLPKEWRDVPRLEKPFDKEQLSTVFPIESVPRL